MPFNFMEELLALDFDLEDTGRQIKAEADGHEVDLHRRIEEELEALIKRAIAEGLRVYLLEFKVEGMIIGQTYLAMPDTDKLDDHLNQEAMRKLVNLVQVKLEEIT